MEVVMVEEVLRKQVPWWGWGDFRWRNGGPEGSWRAEGSLLLDHAGWGCGRWETGEGGQWGMGLELGWAMKRAWTLTFVLLIRIPFLLSDFYTLFSINQPRLL